MRMLMIGAALVAASHTASGQDPLAAVRKAQKAAAATNAHIEAEQRPEDTQRAQAAPAPAGKAAPAAKSPAPAAKVRKSATTPATKGGTKLAAAPTDTSGPPATIYRESFTTRADGRRDPFNSLLTTNELRPALSDLRLTGVLYDHTGGHSVATLRDLGTNAQYRVTTGSTLGRMRVSTIRYTTVVFTIDEFGTTRQDSLILRDTTKARGK